MSRLDRIERDIERAQKRVAEWQEKVRELDGQRVEAENIGIVSAIRALKMTPAELRAFIRTGALPATLRDEAAITPARFERKPRATDRPAATGKPDPATDDRKDPATPAAAPTDTITDKESEADR
jgi:hypothetical protein